MTEIINPEASEKALESTQEKVVQLTSKELANFEHWDGITSAELEERIARMDFIVDNWGLLDSYAGLTLPKGWKLVTTSLRGSTLGTVLIASDDPNKTRRLNRTIKTFVSNHGLRLAQADTFIETLYYAKFLLLPLLSVVLADKNLYRAYRNYSRQYTMNEYVNWIHEHELHNSQFNVKLTPTERVQISELLDRMARADTKLRDVRAAARLKYQDRQAKNGTTA